MSIDMTNCLLMVGAVMRISGLAIAKYAYTFSIWQTKRAYGFP